MLCIQSPQVCPGTIVDLHVNVTDTDSGLTIGQLNDTVPLTINITVKVPVAYTAPSSKNLTINVVLTSVVGSLSFQNHSVSLSSKKFSCISHTTLIKLSKELQTVYNRAF